MIKEEDFQAIVKVFHSAIKEMVDKDTFLERKAVVVEWEEFMHKVDVCMAQMLQESNPTVRRGILAEFEERLKTFGYIK